MENTIKLHAWGYADLRSYLFAVLFAAGNLALPQLCHLFHLGGAVLLPIYFFTLIAAYKYGLYVGLLTAVLSPVANSLLFGMPVAAALPMILVKSVLLAFAAYWVARRFQKLELLSLAGAIVFYQIVGTLIQWAVTGDAALSFGVLALGLPGMFVQLLGGYAVLKAISKY